MPLMRRSFQIIATLLLFAAPASAGITYDFKSTTTGLSNQTVAGRVHAEGKSVRVDIATGDGVLFKNGSFVVSSNGGLNMTVVDPAAKTFYQIDLAQLLGGGGLLEQLGDVTMEVRDPKVSVTGGADAGTLEGFTAKKSKVATAYEIAVSAFGQPLTVRMQVDSDVWWTDQLSADFTNFLQMRGLRTGMDAIDKLIDALEAFEIQGLKNNIPAVIAILRSEPFRAGQVHTGLIPEVLGKKR